jgi:single-strand DNA-binding protein
MHRHAANSAAQLSSFLKAPSVAILSREKRNECDDKPSFYGENTARMTTAVEAHFRSQNADEYFGPVGACRFVSRPLLGHRFGAIPSPGGTRSSASLAAPLRGLGSSLNKFESRGKERHTNFFRAPPRKQTFGAWEPGPLRLMATRAGCGKFNETEITIMYQNKVNLIGFLGSDAEVRTNDNRSFTTLSLATKSSYKKDGKYIEHTEWHRCVVFGKLGEFAGTLKKGAHIVVEGELRSREYDSKKTSTKQTIWEIRVNSILKLDRAAKASPDEQEHDDAPAEEVAA